jgi:hypothetical protein
MVVLFGAVLCFVTTWGEPAVCVLADHVEEASTGAIRVPRADDVFGHSRRCGSAAMLDEIICAAELKATGQGVAFVLPVGGSALPTR